MVNYHDLDSMNLFSDGPFTNETEHMFQALNLKDFHIHHMLKWITSLSMLSLSQSAALMSSELCTLNQLKMIAQASPIKASCHGGSEIIKSEINHDIHVD